jgi:Protein of unknown function (DUF3987)/Primase C terminal 2 (PriCT-2)
MIHPLYCGPSSEELAAIPAPMKQRDQWVLFALVEEATASGELKLTKVPLNARTLGGASSTNSSTWSAIDRCLKSLPGALHRWEQDPSSLFNTINKHRATPPVHQVLRGAGLGFVFSESDPFTFVDIDHSVDERGGIAPWAQEIVDTLQSYTQTSVSGTGLHVFIAATMPSGGKQKGDLQMWDHGRFCAMTGRHLPETPRTIEPRQGQLNLIHRAHIAPPPREAPQPLPRQDQRSYGPRDDERARVEEALRYIPADDYETWLQTSMALHASDAAWAYDVWAAWSRSGKGYDRDENMAKWRSFKADGNGSGKVTLGTLFGKAKEFGYRPVKSFPRFAQKSPRFAHDSHKTGEEKVLHNNNLGADSHDSPDSHRGSDSDFTETPPQTEPDPLQGEMPPIGEYPAHALGKILGDAARVLHQYIKAPLPLCGQALLAAAAQAAQGHANVVMSGRRIPLAVYALTIAESGERKTAVDEAATLPQRRREEELGVEHKTARLRFNNANEAYKRQKESILKNTPDSLVEDQLNALPPPPLPPLDPVLLVEEPTYEGMVKLLETGQPTVGLFSNEGGRFIGGYALSKDHRIKTLSGLNSLWDGGPISRVRSGDGAVKLYGRRVSLHLMAQPKIAAKLLQDGEVEDIGFLARCLVCWPESTIGTREYVDEDYRETPEIQKYMRVIDHLLAQDLPLKDSATGGEYETRNTLQPRDIPVTPAGKKLYIKFYEYVEFRLGKDQQYADIRSFGSKAADMALRLAGTLALIENSQVASLEPHHVAQGIALMQFYLDEWLRLIHGPALDEDLHLADQLRTWSQGFEYIYSSLVYRNGPSRKIREKTTALRIIDVLVSHGWLVRVSPMVLDEKLRKEVWRVVHV